MPILFLVFTLNDSILIFIIKENEQFSVYANEPIIVDLPATGYTLKVDLVKFDLLYEEELQGYHCSILGYYYFNPLEPETQRKQRTIARNRTEHYYNSSMHFCRSLYHNALAENGYLFERNCIPENSVLFSNTIATKGISSLLPEDYIPSMR